MSYQIVAADDAEGTVTYEINYGSGVLREQLLISDYPTASAIKGRIQQREVDIKKEIVSRKATVIPDAIKSLVGK